jgi:hypothetical protein
LTRLDATTFEYPYPGNFNGIPADTVVTVYVYDREVSAEQVARDIYVNGTRIRVETVVNSVTGGVMEYGKFKVGKTGSVY